MGKSPDLPGYCAHTLTLMSVGSTSQRSVQVPGFASIGLLPPLRRLYPLPVRQTSALPSASSRFRLATDTLAVRLTLPLAGCVEDLHLQVSAPCRAHQVKSPILERMGLLYYAGDHLISHTLTRAVPSAQRGLTSVFGMGAGVTLPLNSPANF